jgi:hypothetical protein
MFVVGVGDQLMGFCTHPTLCAGRALEVAISFAKQLAQHFYRHFSIPQEIP